MMADPGYKRLLGNSANSFYLEFRSKICESATSVFSVTAKIITEIVNRIICNECN